MTEDKSISTQDAPGSFRWLLSEWAGGMAQAIEGMGSPAPIVEVADATDLPRGDGSFWWAQELSLIAGHSIWIGAQESSWREISAGALQATGIDALQPGDIRDAYREILRQSFSALAARLSAHCQNEITCLAGVELADPPDTGSSGLINLRSGANPSLPLYFVASPQLLQKLDPGTPPSPDSTQPESAESAALSLEAVLDLEIPVSVSLGVGRLSLQQALLLNPGSLVPLSRRANDLAELHMNGRAVARGQLVSVRGQYGIRIQELLSREERLREAGVLGWAGQG